MSQPVSKLRAMSPEEYLAWHVRQDDRYEYVDGAPQLKHMGWDGPRMMVGATQAHMLLAGNVFAALRDRLKSSRCRAVAADGKVVTPRGNYRYPDVAVDCGPFAANSTVLSEPALVVEVWSKSTRWIDLSRKLDDYRSVSAIGSILFLSQESCSGQLWTRDGDWTLTELEDAEAQVDIPSLGISLTLGAFYEGLNLADA